MACPEVQPPAYEVPKPARNPPTTTAKNPDSVRSARQQNNSCGATPKKPCNLSRLRKTTEAWEICNHEAETGRRISCLVPVPLNWRQASGDCIFRRGPSAAYLASSTKDIGARSAWLRPTSNPRRVLWQTSATVSEASAKADAGMNSKTPLRHFSVSEQNPGPVDSTRCRNKCFAFYAPEMAAQEVKYNQLAEPESPANKQ